MIAALAVKATPQGLLIYATMALYLAAAAFRALRRVRCAWGLYAAGFAVALASVLYRGLTSGYWPLSNLFEVMLFVAMLMFPLSLLGRLVLRVGAEAGDMVLGVLFLFAPAFVFDAEPKALMPALQTPLFVPHVASYMIAYAIFAKAAIQSILQLATGNRPRGQGLVDPEEGAFRTASLAFPLLTAGLLLGCWWIKVCSGDWWNWDPKEMWGLASWIAYIAYFHARALLGRRMPWLGAVLCLIAMGTVLLTLFWVSVSKFFKGYHVYGMG